MNPTPTKNKPNHGMKILIAALLSICIAALLHLRAEHARSQMAKDSAVRLSSKICEIICPAGWKSDQAGDSFRFVNPDGSFIIFDVSQDLKYMFSPLDTSTEQLSMIASEVLSKYGIKKPVSVGAVSVEKNSGISQICLPFSLDGKSDNGTAEIFFSHDLRFVYIASWTGAPSSRSAIVCQSAKNHIILKSPYLTPLYVTPTIDSSEFADVSELLKSAEESYRQAKQIWKNAKDSPADIANTIKAYQDAMNFIAQTNSGGMMFSNSSSLANDIRIVSAARTNKLERMKSEIVQYMKLGDSQMASRILDDMLASASFENEIAFKEWALKTKSEIKTEQ